MLLTFPRNFVCRDTQLPPRQRKFKIPIIFLKVESFLHDFNFEVLNMKNTRNPLKILIEI